MNRLVFALFALLCGTVGANAWKPDLAPPSFYWVNPITPAYAGVHGAAPAVQTVTAGGSYNGTQSLCFYRRGYGAVQGAYGISGIRDQIPSALTAASTGNAINEEPNNGIWSDFSSSSSQTAASWCPAPSATPYNAGIVPTVIATDAAPYQWINSGAGTLLYSNYNVNVVTVDCGSNDPNGTKEVDFTLEGGATVAVTIKTKNPVTGSIGYAIRPTAGSGRNGPMTLAAKCIPNRGFDKVLAFPIYVNDNPSDGTYITTRPQYYADAINGNDSWDGSCAYNATNCDGTSNHGPWATFAYHLGATAAGATCGNFSNYAAANSGAVINLANGTYLEAGLITRPSSCITNTSVPFEIHATNQQGATLTTGTLYTATTGWSGTTILPASIVQLDGVIVDRSTVKTLEGQPTSKAKTGASGIWASNGAFNDEGGPWCGALTANGCMNYFGGPGDIAKENLAITESQMNTFQWDRTHLYRNVAGYFSRYVLEWDRAWEC